MKDTVTFEYPFSHVDYEFPERSKIVKRKASLKPIQIDHEPYEVLLVNDHKLCFHLIFGKTVHSQGFLCIPCWDFGCEIADLRNKVWNLDSILSIDHKFTFEDAVTITYALAEIAELLN